MHFWSLRPSFTTWKAYVFSWNENGNTELRNELDIFSNWLQYFAWKFISDLISSIFQFIEYSSDPSKTKILSSLQKKTQKFEFWSSRWRWRFHGKLGILKMQQLVSRPNFPPKLLFCFHSLISFWWWNWRFLQVNIELSPITNFLAWVGKVLLIPYWASPYWD